MQLVVVVEVDRTESGLLCIEAQHNNKYISSCVQEDEITDLNDLAAWLLNQTSYGTMVDPDLQKKLTIDFHVEQVINPETGQPLDTFVVDDVSASPIPRDQGKADFQNLPGWATWTASQAENWIQSNVTDLASAKVALVAMAKAIIYLRNVSVD